MPLAVIKGETSGMSSSNRIKGNMSELSEEDIKPMISHIEVEMILERFFGLKECIIKKLAGYDDLNYHCSPKSINNPFINQVWPHGYVLKIMNSLDSKNNDLCEAQNTMMLHLRENNIPSPVPVKNIYGRYYIKENFPLNSNNNNNKIRKKHIIRLLEYQEGTILKDIPKSYPLFYKLGVFVAKLNEALKKFYHPVYETHYSAWHLHCAPEVKTSLNVIKDSKRKNLVNDVLEKFVGNILLKEDTFEKGMIHGDFNEHNVLMKKSETNDWIVSAVLDFGDSHMSCYIFELAISLCYMMFECKRNNLDPIVGAGHFLAGYLTIHPTLEVDFALLKLCICARICQSVTLGLKAFNLHPENAYVLDSQAMGWPLVEELWSISDAKINRAWNTVINSYKS